ncbi:unnamed protein product [Rhizophagus irregularis]|nr:unnamed protein product [Rhizophagus irregularis]
MFRQVWIGGKILAPRWIYGFRLSVFGRLILFRLLVLGRLLLISAFGSWMFRLLVLGRLLLISAISFWVFDIGFDFRFLDVCYWFRLSVLGSLIYKFRLSISAFSSYAFDLKLSVMAATSHWALDRFQLRYLWICEIQRMLQNFLFKEIDSDLDTIRKSAPESQ